MADEAPGARWRVVDVRQDTNITPSGSFQDVYKIYVETSYGGLFTVTVPRDLYTPDAVAAQIEAEYELHERTRFLSG